MTPAGVHEPYCRWANVGKPHEGFCVGLFAEEHPLPEPATVGARQPQGAPVSHQWDESEAGADVSCVACRISVEATRAEVRPSVPCPAPACEDPTNDLGACVFLVDGSNLECSYCGASGGEVDDEDDPEPGVVYDARTLPEGQPQEVTLGPLRLWRVSGPATVTTAAGDVELPEDFVGGIAVGADGLPMVLSSSQVHLAH